MSVTLGESTEATPFIGSLLGSIGLNYVNGGEESLEQIVELNPELLFVVKGSNGQAVFDDWKTNTLWKDLYAVQNGTVFEVDSNLWLGSQGLTSSELILDDAVKHLSSK